MTKTDKKNVALGVMLLQLRHGIDIHRVIGLNHSKFRKRNFPWTFLGYVQQSAIRDVVLGISKIYEFESRSNELNSIPGALRSLKHHTFSESQAKAAQEFARSSGYDGLESEALALLKGSFERTSKKHEITLKRLRTFRDKVVAHSEYQFEIETLPSHNEFEALFEFAKEFYRFISRYIVDVHPAYFGRHVGMSLRELLIQLGLDAVKWDFRSR